MEYLPQLNHTQICEHLFSSKSEQSIRRIIEDEDLAPNFIDQLLERFDLRNDFLKLHTMPLSVIDWDRAKRMVGQDYWIEYVVHLRGKPYQLKVYMASFMRERQSPEQNLMADVDQLIVQSALSELGLARPILGVVPPSMSESLGRELYRRGLIGAEQKDAIYFATLFQYFDNYSAVIIPDASELPHWFDQMGRSKIKVKIVGLEFALSRMGILHGGYGHFIVSADGNVQLADFDYLRGTGFRPKHAGDFSSIFINPLESVRNIFGSP
jgi:hypothetical protein